MSQIKKPRNIIAYIAIIDVILGTLVLFAASKNFTDMSLESVTITFVIEIFLIEIEEHFVPAMDILVTSIGEHRLLAIGEKTALSRSRKLREKAEECVYGIWCYPGYNDKRLEAYFDPEKKIMKKAEVHRLINVELIGADKVKKHCMKLMDEIISGKYVVYAADYHNREFLIVDHRHLFILIQNLISKDVAGGIGPFDNQHLVGGFQNEYDEMEKEFAKHRLIITDRNLAEKNIDDWINGFKSRAK